MTYEQPTKKASEKNVVIFDDKTQVAEHSKIWENYNPRFLVILSVTLPTSA